MGASPRDSTPIDTLGIFAAIIGEDAALSLVVRFGGRKLYIPKDPPSAGELVEVIGEHAALVLARRFGGTHFEMPLERGKRERIIAFSTQAKPLPVREIARRVGCTERHVYQVRRQYLRNGVALPLPADEPADRRQLDIFGPADPTTTEG
ncbi:MAG: helix-turn-helix domain-containing protein [Gemmatimonadaceae bacterium]